MILAFCGGGSFGDEIGGMKARGSLLEQLDQYGGDDALAGCRAGEW